MQDTERGGWYGQMLADGTIVSDAPRGAILNARILWAFYAACRVLGKTEYLDAATRTYEYICLHFVDCVYGGIYWSVDAEGKVNTNEDHAGFWKCPYHNTRMCLEIIERQLSPD